MRDFEAAMRSANLLGDLGTETTFYDMSKQSRSLSAMTSKSLKLFGEEMDTSLAYMRPSIKKLIVDNVVPIVDTMRLANTETKSGYGGSTGSGSSLSFTTSWAYDFIDPDIVSAAGSTAVYPGAGHGITTDNRRTWTRSVTVPPLVSAPSVRGTPTPFITGLVAAVGTPVDLQVQEEEAMIFLGMVDKTDVNHIATAMQVVYNSDTMNYWNMPFESLEDKNESIVLWEMPQAVIVPPEQSIQINVRYDETGTSYMYPLVIRFLRSSDMRTL